MDRRMSLPVATLLLALALPDSAFTAEKDVSPLVALFGDSPAEVHVGDGGEDFPSLLWAPGRSISLKALSCEQQVEVADLAWCAFVQLMKLTDRGGTLIQVDPNPEFVRTLANGEIAVRFQQRLNGLELLDSWATLIFNSDLTELNRVASSIRDGIEAVSIPEKSFESEVPMLAANLGMRPTNDSRIAFYLLNAGTTSRSVRPVLVTSAADENGSEYELVIDAADLRVLETRPLWASYVPIEINSNLRAVEHTTSFCPSSFYCSFGYTCVRNRCLKACSVDADCTFLGASWRCSQETTSQFYHFCFDNSSFARVPVFSAISGWLLAGYQYFTLFSKAYDAVSRLNTWLETKLDILGYDNAGSTSVVNIDAFDGDTSFWSYTQGKFFQKVTVLPDVNESDESRSGRYSLYGHEFGHGIYWSSSSRFLTDECAEESHAFLHGALFAANEISSTWGVYSTSAYGDECWGLAGNSKGIPYLPYAYRSAFDNGQCLDNVRDGGPLFTSQVCNPNAPNKECKRYEYCRIYNQPTGEYRCSAYSWYQTNATIWKRFARIAAEGSNTFLENPAEVRENNISLQGLGPDRVAEIYSSVVQSGVLNSNSSLENFAINLVAASGQDSESMKRALGMIGMPSSSWTTLQTTATDQATTIAYYSDSPQQDKSFTIWKVANSGDISVRYSNGPGSYVTTTWAANTDTSPVVEIFNSRLHIFYRNASDASIRVRYFTPTLSFLAESNLGERGIYTNGNFDAEVFNSALYLVYTNGTSGNVRISKCVSPTYGCTSVSSYWQLYSGAYFKTLPWTAYPGLAAVDTYHLFGTSYSEASHLYIAFSDRSTALGDHRVGMVRINNNDEPVVLLPIYVDDNSPSNRTAGRIGLQAWPSALGYSNGYKHIFLFWKDLSSNAMVGSVLQRWDGTSDYTAPRPTDDVEPYWFTRPRKFRTLTSQFGVTIAERGATSYFESIDVVTQSSTGFGSRVPFYGWY